MLCRRVLCGLNCSCSVGRAFSWSVFGSRTSWYRGTTAPCYCPTFSLVSQAVGQPIVVLCHLAGNNFIESEIACRGTRTSLERDLNTPMFAEAGRGGTLAPSTNPAMRKHYISSRTGPVRKPLSFRTGHVQNRPSTWCPNRASETAGPVPGSGRSCTGPIASILRALACAARSDLRRYPSVTSRFEVSAMA